MAVTLLSYLFLFYLLQSSLGLHLRKDLRRLLSSLLITNDGLGKQLEGQAHVVSIDSLRRRQLGLLGILIWVSFVVHPQIVDTSPLTFPLVVGASFCKRCVVLTVQ